MVRLGGKRKEGKHSMIPYCMLVLVGRACTGQVNCSWWPRGQAETHRAVKRWSPWSSYAMVMRLTR